MKSQFRPTAPGDASAVAAFLQRIFNVEATSPLIGVQHLHWKSWEERPDWPGSRGYVLTKEDAIVAHATVVPLSYVRGQQRLTMVHLIDWAADPKIVGSGVTLLRQITQLVDAVLIVGGSDTAQKVLPALGFKNHGEVTRFARPLRPLRRIAGQGLSLRIAAQFTRSLLWSLRAVSVRAPGWTSTRTGVEELQSQPIPMPRSVGEIAILQRSASMLAYFLNCSVTPMELHLAAKDGVGRGYFLLAYAPGQARIVDFYVDSEDRGDWLALLQLAVAETSRNQGAAEVVSYGSDPVTRQALLDCGFHARGNITVRVLAGKGVELPSGPIRFHMIDNDAAYMHDKKDSFWA